MPGKINTDEALKLYADGLSDGDLARHFGVTQSGATRWRQRQGLKPNVVATSRPALSDQERRLMRKLLRQGATVEQVAREVGCGERVITRMRSKMKGDDRLRKSGKILRGTRSAARKDAAAILDELKAATRRITDTSIRDDTMGEMFLAFMEGRLRRDQIKTEARKYSGRQMNLWQSPWAPASIDEAMTEDGLRLVDLIACPAADAWLENVGA